MATWYNKDSEAVEMSEMSLGYLQQALANVKERLAKVEADRSAARSFKDIRHFWGRQEAISELKKLAHWTYLYANFERELEAEIASRLPPMATLHVQFVWDDEMTTWHGPLTYSALDKVQNAIARGWHFDAGILLSSVGEPGSACYTSHVQFKNVHELMERCKGWIRAHNNSEEPK